MEEDEQEQNELFEHYNFVADPGQQLLRVDLFLLARIENTSRNRIQNVALAGNVIVNGKTVKSNCKIKPGDKISVVMPYPPREKEILPEKLGLNILLV